MKTAQTEIDPIVDAFRLHDEMGVPLTVSVACGAQKGIKINFACFYCDAQAAEWMEDKIFREIAGACADNGISFNKAEFLRKLNQLFALAVKPDEDHPGCWASMKRFVMEANNRTKL